MQNLRLIIFRKLYDFLVQPHSCLKPCAKHIETDRILLMLKLILGSKSPARREILSSMGYEFTVLDPNIDEKAIRSDDPCELVLKLAHAKADALIERIDEDAILLTADQVVLCDNKILEKPNDLAEAREFFHHHSLAPAETVAAVVAVNTKNGRRESGVDIAKVYFKPFPEDVIDKILLDPSDVLSRAGGFSIENPIIKKYITRIDGATDSVMGMPKRLVVELLAKIL